MPVLSWLCRFVKKYFECDLLVIAGSQLTHAGHVGPCNVERLPFIRKFRRKFSVKWYWQFFCIETGIRLNCAIYKIPANFSLSLERNLGTGNPNKWYRKFWLFQ